MKQKWIEGIEKDRIAIEGTFLLQIGAYQVLHHIALHPLNQCYRGKRKKFCANYSKNGH